MKYKCILLDHDDTSVNSTATVHYPAYCEIMDTLRSDQPELKQDLEGWFLKNFDPGVADYYQKELQFSLEEQRQEYAVWRSYTENKELVPDFYDGVLGIICEFQQNGGVVVVCSHSEADIIENHYRKKGNGIFPDLIFGWNDDHSKMKPQVYPVEVVQQRYNLKPEEILVVDDLKPGFMMAQQAGVDFAAAGWSHSIEPIAKFMRQHANYYLGKVAELREIILGN
jgi:phosphoglycolate phosphatase/pyrophosphatase PpaX